MQQETIFSSSSAMECSVFGMSVFEVLGGWQEAAVIYSLTLRSFTSSEAAQPHTLRPSPKPCNRVSALPKSGTDFSRPLRLDEFRQNLKHLGFGMWSRISSSVLYIYIHTHTHTYIYIYIHTYTPRLGGPSAPPTPAGS